MHPTAVMSDSPLPPCDISGYEPPASLWGLVENNVPESERLEVKRMMGESLVEQSLELHDEVRSIYVEIMLIKIFLLTFAG